MSADIACSNPDCTAPSGGPCAAGHAAPTDCPNATVPESTATVPPSADLPIPPTKPGRALSAAVSLSVEQANALAAERGAHVVFPLGPREVGKTTLLVELYGRYLGGPWAATTFAGSRTLLDFELVAFPSRLASRAELPDTWRTRLEDEDRPVLHLAVQSSGGLKDLLFINLSGEFSDRVTNGGDPAQELPLLAASDHVLVCVDGAEVAGSPALCTRACSHAHQFIRVLAERGTFADQAQLALVLTKLDVVTAAGVEERWERERLRLFDAMQQIGRPAEQFKVAARTLEAVPADDGMAALLDWLLGTQTGSEPTLSTQAPPPTRAMGRLADDGGS